MDSERRRRARERKSTVIHCSFDMEVIEANLRIKTTLCPLEPLHALLCPLDLIRQSGKGERMKRRKEIVLEKRRIQPNVIRQKVMAAQRELGS